MKAQKVKYIMVHESILGSIIKDTFSIVSLSATIWFADVMGYPAMQWVIVPLWVVMACIYAAKFIKKKTIYTFENIPGFFDKDHKRANHQ